MIYLRYAIFAIILALGVLLSLANSGPVTLSLWPDTIASFLGRDPSITLPLFVIICAALGLGLVLGLVWEWLREWSIRRDAARTQRELEALQYRERTTPVPAVRRPRDEILEIVDEPKSVR